MSKPKVCKVAVLGLGHVGLPLAALLAVNGIPVQGFDISSNAIARIKKGKVNFQEPGLNEILKRALKSGALTVSTAETRQERPQTFLNLKAP